MAAPSAPAPSTAQRLRDFAVGIRPLAVIFALLTAVSFLPSDTALREVNAAGRVSVCMPPDYPPLVLATGERPGFDVELLQEVADRSGWRLAIVSNSAMGRDFNPRSWRVTRAQCRILAGGLALSPTTRSFLDTTSGHLRTGWVMVADEGVPGLAAGTRVGFYPGLTGLDRVGLGQYLRGIGVETRLVPTAAALRQGLEDGSFDVAITEALLAEQTFREAFWVTEWLPEDTGRYPVGIGFWRGDLTLRVHVERMLATLAREGFVDELAAAYGLGDPVLCLGASRSC